MDAGREDGARGPRAERRRSLRPFLALSVSALAVFLAGTGWLAFYPPVPADLDGAPDLDHQARRVRIPVAADTLDGWLLEGPRRTMVVVFHGYGRDHHRAWRYGAFLNRAGYDVLTVDFRSSRSRDRLPTTLGRHEADDAAATLAWARRAPALRGHRVVLYGESLGGSVAIVTAARDGAIAAVIADCPFATGRRALEDTFEYWLKVPGAPVATAVAAAGKAFTGHDPGGLDAVAAAESLGTTPLLLVSAEGDDRMRAAQAEDLRRATGGRAELWLTAGGHNEGWQRLGQDYERRVLAFLDRALAGDAPATRE